MNNFFFLFLDRWRKLYWSLEQFLWIQWENWASLYQCRIWKTLRYMCLPLIFTWSHGDKAASNSDRDLVKNLRDTEIHRLSDKTRGIRKKDIYQLCYTQYYRIKLQLIRHANSEKCFLLIYSNVAWSQRHDVKKE